MLKELLIEWNSEHMEEIFEFKGLWDISSKCGLKIIEKGDKTIVVVTELYNFNPGTSIATFCAQLATIICKEKNLDPLKFRFIIHNPEIKSKLSFLNEFFYTVDLEWNGEKFLNPKWVKITKEKFEKIIYV